MSSGSDIAEIIEAKLYAEAELIGEYEDIGPYSLINTIAIAGAKRIKPIRPALALRIKIFEDPNQPKVTTRTIDEHYHGGDIADEISALVSLAVGIRLKAGPFDRIFQPNESSYGRPIEYSDKTEPMIIGSYSAPQLPRLRGRHDLSPVVRLNNFGNLKPISANTLVKAARLYQDAVWMADAEPALAWLLLVSAVEAAAALHGSTKRTPRQHLEEAMPEIAKLLVNDGSDKILDNVAEVLAKLTGATLKFVDFIVTFAPDPPPERPNDWLRFSFLLDDLRKAAKKIYTYRSKALHGGIAFPLPMCLPPQRFEGEGWLPGYQEVPMGSAMGRRNASWLREDTPMLLHVFEYIARGALLNWWDSLMINNPNDASPSNEALQP